MAATTATTPEETQSSTAQTQVETQAQPVSSEEKTGRIAKRRAWLESLPKPKLRGWSHAVMAPLTLANSIVLVVLAPTVGLRAASVVFGASAVVLFGNSAVYHIGRWSVRVHSVLRRIDHSNIFLLIAGTYTPLSVALLDKGTAILVLSIVWGGSLAGILMSVFFPNAPRWLSTPLYVLLGWVAIWFLPDFWRAGGPAIVWLVIAGGIAYTIGAIFYGFRWPNPWPRVWGFHEFFHLGTVAGYVCQAVAVWLAVMTAV
ncbi:MAG: hemolysin III family protein [Actinomycetaceae bacterium]|nr:hemolysin III family protein [Actinomycetaceae bacterium]